MVVRPRASARGRVRNSCITGPGGVRFPLRVLTALQGGANQMLRKVSVRFTVLALAAGSLAVIPLSATSSAATKVACTKETSGKPTTVGTTITVKASLGGCSASVGGSGKSVTTIKGKAAPVSKT